MKKLKILFMMLVSCMIASETILAADTIPIGVPIPMTGWAAGSGADYFKGIKMAVDEINESGGLLGKQIEIIRFDSKGFEPETVMQAADYLCGQRNVAAVHAGWAGWGQDFRSYGKYDQPFFADDASQSAVEIYRENPEKYSNCFQLSEVEPNQAKSDFRILMKLPHNYPNKKAVIINSDDSWGRRIGDSLEENFEKKGWKVSFRETVPYGINEWGVISSKIRRVKPAIIHFEIASGQENITFVQQFLKQPTNSIVSLGWGLCPREVLSTLGNKANGLIGSMPSGLPGPKAPNPKAQAWMDKFVKLYDHRVPVGAWAVYTAVKAWANAVMQVGDAYNFKTVNKYIKDFGYEGELGVMKWDKDNVLRAQPAAPMVHYQVQNGELQTIFTDPPIKPYLSGEFVKPPWIK